MPDPTPAGDDSVLPLVLDRVGFSARGKAILDDVDLTLGATGTTVVLGYNGAGKSVFLRLIHGLLTPTRGALRWAGGRSTRDARRCQAMVFQTPVLLRRAVTANIAFALRVAGWSRSDARERAAAVVAAHGLEAIARRYPRYLSGGERQRVALARALATAPEMLLLDEPTANLDPFSAGAVEARVRAASAAGTRVILVTHDLGQARRLADDIVFIHRGRALEHRAAAQFFAAPSSAAARCFVAGELPPAGGLNLS